MVAITVLNGALPTSVLTSIGSGFTLRHDAAASYLRARADGAPAGITTAYRTKVEQKRLLNLYGYPRAEYPGRSQHGEGVALDIPEPARSWFAARGIAYGWTRTVSFEPWHFEYQPARDTHIHDTTQEDDVNLTDIIGTNPATGKPSTVSEALQIARNYAYQAWKVGLSQGAQVSNLIGAVAALAGGEAFDETKLLAGVQASASKGARAGTTAALADVDGIVRDALADVAGADADAIVALIAARLAA